MKASGIGMKGVLATILLGLMGTLPAQAGEDPAALPTFSLPDLDGKSWSSSEFMGKAVVIDFWATWCTTCEETVPKLAELSDKHKGKGLIVVGVSVDKGSSAKIRKAAAKLGINYLVLLDPGNTLAPLFGFSGIPSLYLFDRRGALAKGMPGYDPDQEKQLASAVETAVNAAVAPVARQTEVEESPAAGKTAATPARKPAGSKPKRRTR